MGAGTVVKVKVNNGTKDLQANDFTFDWSAASPAPANATADVAEFTISDKNLSVAVTVTDKMELVAVNGSTGKFYSLNKMTGAATEAFTITYNASPLTSIRGFAYNYSNGLYYASTNSNAGGKLYSINPSTKQATVINDNSSGTWDAIASVVVTPDNKLLTTMYVEDQINGQSLTTFSLTGTSSTPIKLTGNPDIGSGMGMTYSSATELLIGDYNNYNVNNKARIHKTSLNGIISETVLLDFVNFGTLTNADIYIRSLVKDENSIIYGLVLVDGDGDNNTKNDFITHLVRVDISNKTMTSIAKIGMNGTNQYFGLANIPSHLY